MQDLSDFFRDTSFDVQWKVFLNEYGKKCADELLKKVFDLICEHYDQDVGTEDFRGRWYNASDSLYPEMKSLLTEIGFFDPTDSYTRYQLGLLAIDRVINIRKDFLSRLHSL